ncbi:MAG: hypothetical protein R2791_12500 [Saprospiraceae bacterium]|nr:hypothetical protein [Lewinellaceae bacterium]
MSLITNLDAIIRQIAKREDLSQSENLIILDAKTGEALDKMPGLLSFRQVNLYALSNVQTANCAGPNYKLASGVLLEIPFAAGVPTGREQQVAQAMQQLREQGREASIESALNNRIKQWIADFIRDHSEGKMLDLSDELQFHLKKKALDELGLHLRPNISFKHDGQLEPLLLLSESAFPVHVKDYDEALLVRFEAELAVSDPIRAVAQWKKPDELEEMVVMHIKKYCQHHLTLNEFAEYFKTTIRDSILQELNNRFEPFGRKFNFLNFKIESNLPLKPDTRIFQFEETVKEKIKDFGNDITVQNRVLIEVADLARFRAAKESINLQQWVQDVVQAAVKKRLMASTYKNLLLQQDNFIQEVREIIRFEADKIGLKVTEHIVLPELKERRLVTEGFLVNYQNYQFHTGGSSPMPIALNIFVKGRLDEKGLIELDDIYLGEKADVFKSIEDAVLSKLRELIIRRTPEKLFLKFEVPDSEDTNSTQEFLNSEIKQLLIEEFKAKTETLVISITHGENEIITKAKALLGKTNGFEHVHKALGGNGAELTYTFQYRIARVRDNGWHLFYQNVEFRTPDELVEEINNILPGRIDSVFQNLRFEDKVSTGLIAEQYRREALKKGAFDFVGQIFGLDLVLLNHQRKAFQAEIEEEKIFNERSLLIGKNTRESMTKELDNQFSELNDLKRNLKKEEAEEMRDEKEIARLKREIELIEREIKGNKFDTIHSARDSFLGTGSLTNFDKPKIGDDADQKSDD